MRNEKKRHVCWYGWQLLDTWMYALNCFRCLHGLALLIFRTSTYYNVQKVKESPMSEGLERRWLLNVSQYIEIGNMTSALTTGIERRKLQIEREGDWVIREWKAKVQILLEIKRDDLIIKINADDVRVPTARGPWNTSWFFPIKFTG